MVRRARPGVNGGGPGRGRDGAVTLYSPTYDTATGIHTVLRQQMAVPPTTPAVQACAALLGQTILAGVDRLEETRSLRLVGY